MKIIALFVTNFISPNPAYYWQVKQFAPIVSNCMVVGDKKKFLSLVCTLRSVISETLEPTDELDWISLDQCQKLGSTSRTGKWTLYSGD